MLECRYKGQCRIEYDTDFDVCYPCIGDWGDTCARYEPMPDVDALRAMADELDMCADGCRRSDRAPLTAEEVWECARRLREACGEGGEMKEWIVCADKPTRAMERMHVGDVVRCRDCASIKPTTDGRRYCTRWSHIVPLDGFCWRGEAKSGEEAQEG